MIRQISAIFDTQALGYDSSLVAAKVTPAQLVAAAEAINAHPGVSHNYQRDHAYNLWFTVAVPRGSRLGLSGTVEHLAAASGAAAMRLMPTLRLFKIGVKLDLAGAGGAGEQDDAVEYGPADRAQAERYALDESDRRLVRVLQQDLALSRDPFDAWARQMGVSVAELLASGRRLEQRRQMRRFAAVLRHRSAGFAANAMGVWAVADDRVEAVGRQLAGFKAVSHCYQRPTYDDWPYNLFTMVHARTRADCEAELAAMAEATGVTWRAALYSVRQFKKTRVRYFTGEIEAWEAQGARPPEAVG